jgi:glycosyltransferase involved in cell wall biosynthesis
MTGSENKKALIVVVGYNVAKILPKTIQSIPPLENAEIVVVDDGSGDGTGEVARSLGLQVLTHEKNRGYGGAQKTGYREAIKRDAALAVLVHGDNQYDPTLVPRFISKIRDEGYEAVTGTRMILGDALMNGMPLWKFIPNRLLTHLENFVFQTNISDYHNGFRAFSTDFLRRIPLDLLSDKFDFDTDIIIQAAIRRARIAEIPHPTRYLDENSQMPFTKAVRYGLSIMWTVTLYILHATGIKRQRLFEQDVLVRGMASPNTFAPEHESATHRPGVGDRTFEKKNPE